MTGGSFPQNGSDVVQVLDETSRWRARDVKYWAGRWDKLKDEIPQFKMDDFRASPDDPANPHLRSVVRLPRTLFEKPIPVGVVSNSYTLAQHAEVAEKCFEGIRAAGVETEELHCELGLTQLGEWMNFRVYFPEKYNHKPSDGEGLALRLECFNAVDGWSKLVILLGWLRLVCSNGLVIGETKQELRDIHNKDMDLDKIPGMICKAMKLVQSDLNRLATWQKHSVEDGQVEPWVNDTVSEQWGKKAACRVYHICQSGWDVDFDDPFATGEPSEKPVKRVREVPGAKVPVGNLYDVSQALSWVASRRPNPDERVEWQSAIPELLGKLGGAA
jgi:hypothetical protein